MKCKTVTVQKCLDNYKKGKVVIINAGQFIGFRKEERDGQRKGKGGTI